MARPALSTLALLILAGGCAAREPAAAPEAPAAVSPALPSGAPPAAAPSGAPLAAPTGTGAPDAGVALGPRTVRFVRWNAGGGLDIAGAGSAVMARMPAVMACASGPIHEAGTLEIAIDADASGQVTDVRVEGPIEFPVRACVAEALRKVAFATPSPGGRPMARFALRVELDPSLSSPLPEPPARETLRRFPDGGCFWVESFPCAPHKDCMAPEQRPVSCPVGGAAVAP